MLIELLTRCFYTFLAKKRETLFLKQFLPGVDVKTTVSTHNGALTRADVRLRSLWSLCAERKGPWLNVWVEGGLANVRSVNCISPDPGENE